MTNVLHTSGQEQSTGNGVTSPEPDLIAQNLIISVTAISIDLLGSVTFKVQHSDDGNTWFDIPDLATSPIVATGTTNVALSQSVALLNNQRIVWTFDNANSVTFAAYLIGQK